MVSSKKLAEFTECLALYVADNPKAKYDANAICQWAINCRYMLTDEAVDGFIQLVKREFKEVKTMNTIEMLKELVENGGMFMKVCSTSSYLVSYDPAFGVCIVTPDRAFQQNICMYSEFMSSTWKPYVKPVDWSKVPIDTKVLCRTSISTWHKRYYAGFRDGKPTVFEDGCDSWSAAREDDVEVWEQIKLADATE